MTPTPRRLRIQLAGAIAATFFAAVWSAHFLRAQEGSGSVPGLEPAFEQRIKPFLKTHCANCHNVDNMTAGIRVDHLDASVDDKHIRIWEGIKHRVANGTMPPKGLPQPPAEDKQQVVEWIGQALEIARLRPSPKNGIVRRLTVSQYRNTLRELLQLDDELAEILPPDAVSRDGFVNNQETLQLSPLLLEAYLEIAEEALNRAIVDPASKPQIQNFRVDLGASVNPKPIPDKLILGANSELLENQDVLVTELTPVKPFAFEPFRMRTQYRFIEGYAGNDTVRGWRDFDSIYHAVFACLRGSRGYPKGDAYGTVPQGLLLRPAIPNEEIFDETGTYGPKANFKISLRELPDEGRFRVTVLAAKYNDGLLLDAGAPAQSAAGAVTAAGSGTARTISIPRPGLYQVDVHLASPKPPAPADPSRLSEALAGSWPFGGTADGPIDGTPRLIDSPFGKAAAFENGEDAVTVPRGAAIDVGSGDFTVSAWIHPEQLRRGGLFSAGGSDWTPGWQIGFPDGRGTLRLETAGPDGQPSGTVSSTAGAIQAKAWQHVTAVVRRGDAETRLYVNGYPVAKGRIEPVDLDNPKLPLTIGRYAGAQTFHGGIDEIRLYRRALGEAEIQALIEPGRRFATRPPDKPQRMTLTLGDRQFSGTLTQPAFVALRLAAGPLPVRAEYGGVADVGKIVFTPLPGTSELAGRLLAFEKRTPRLGVHLGLRRDCGSTFAPVGPPQDVPGTKLARYVFEGAIANFPSPNVEKDNVNYLAGVREIAVHSEFTDGRDMPRLLVRSVEFEGPFYEAWPPPSHRGIFIDSARKGDSPAYARQIIRSFAGRAYRRPVTAAEETALMAVFTRSFAQTSDFRKSVKDALQVVLTSPQFLFLIEQSSTPKPEPIDSYELASKLSYFLWNGPPDRKTLSLAANGTLRAQLAAEVDRMIADPRFSRFTKEFTSQWLSLDKFDVLEPDRKIFPKLGRDARAQLRQEPIAFIEHLIRNNLPVRNLIDSDFVMANEVVASYYDMGDKTENGFRFTAIPHRRRDLGGLLAQASILAGLSDGRESNPIKRGAWLARRIIAEPPADPPPNVPALKEETANLTLRERLEQHRDQAGCRQCHAKIDPWGIPLEEFDAGGRRKQNPVDARSTLPDHTEVGGLDDLKRYLSQDRIDQVAFSVFKHLATYANGRTLTYNELNQLKQDGRQLRAGGYGMKDMVRFIVQSNLFLEK